MISNAQRQNQHTHNIYVDSMFFFGGQGISSMDSNFAKNRCRSQLRYDLLKNESQKKREYLDQPGAKDFNSTW